MEVSKLKSILKITLFISCIAQLLFLLHRNALHEQVNDNYGNNNEESMASNKGEILQILRQRSSEVLSKCKKNLSSFKVGTGIRGSNKMFHKRKLLSSESQIVMIPEDNLAWCMVPKAASSFIASAIVEAKKLTHMLEGEGQFQELLRKFYRNNLLTSVAKDKNRLASFYITRHPFSRIVPPFKDKLENSSGHDGPYFYRIYGKNIVKNFRRIKDAREKTANKEPTFKEFVLYLINTESYKYDLHWKPVSLLCDVCNYRYNFTIKFENFRSEFPTLLTYFKDRNFLPEKFEVKWKNKGNEDEKKDDITRTYMKQIPRNYVIRLYEIYKTDFVYFNYDVNGYL